ncbi:MAG: hypothetical protein H6737_23355 [Alphaproteobacteria bacterium]|nr:hypothetical protein [Alphaproteobacteria bacterium]
MRLAMCTIGLLACTPDTDSDAPTPAPEGLRWEAVAVEGNAVWGATTAGPYVLGGVGANQRVRSAVRRVDAGDPLVLETVADLAIPRFCGCSLYDPTRGAVIAIGGRDDGFTESRTAERIDLATGTSIALDPGGAADAPVGCWAGFSAGVDRGWVFGGGGQGGFSGDTWRYDPADDSFTRLDIAGPSPRYDAGRALLPDGDLLLVSGMHPDATFDSEVWRFDADTETWAEIPAANAGPPGRRVPFVALTADGGTLYFGYGSDHPQGATVKQDLWSFDLATGTWAELDIGDPPPAGRGFTMAWEGPPGSLGVLAFGSDGDMRVVDDAWVLWP